MTRVAWVESPLQLLNAVEYGAASGETLRIIPRIGFTQLDETTRVLVPQLPANVVVTKARRSAQLSRFAWARKRLIGDALSGQFRAVASFTGARNLVIVDDGSATLELARKLAEGAPLQRMGRKEGRVARWLGRFAGSLIVRALHRGRVTFFTAYSAERAVRDLSAAGAFVWPNDYIWVKAADFDVAAPGSERIVLGSALAQDGFVKPESYVEWVQSAAAGGHATYMPHRRERLESLNLVRGIPGLTVSAAMLPIELVLASSSTLRTIATLPSSTVATLRAIVAPDVEFDVTPVQYEWWTLAADEPLKATMHRIADMNQHHEREA